MRVVLGAWGFGAHLADSSEVWNRRFGTDARTITTFPPMSARFSGMVEPFPFVLAKKVFIDANQYDLLMNGGGDSFLLSSQLPRWLREFENADVLAPIDFLPVLLRNAKKLVKVAEQLLDSNDLATAAAESRRLWEHFLAAPGAKFLPDLESELRGAKQASAWDFSRMLNLAQHPNIAQEIPTERVSVAALQCGHDVFDVVAMLCIATELDAVLCDWEMYDPLYSLALRHSHFSFLSEGAPAPESQNLRWYVPLPKVPSIDHMIELREDPFLCGLRDAEIKKTVSSLDELGSPEAWRAIRTGVQQRLKGIILNPYVTQSQENGLPVLSEQAQLSPVMLDPEETLPNGLRVFIKELTVGSIFSNISGSTILNESLVEGSFNKVSSDDDETAKALLAVAEAIVTSGNPEAGALFDSFNRELQQEAPNNTVLKTLWEGLVQKAPDISKMVDTVGKVSALFA